VASSAAGKYVRWASRRQRNLVYAQGGRRDEAAAPLAEALDRYEQAGAGAWTGWVHARLRALGMRPGPRGPRHRPASGWESLTGTGRAVSLLMAGD
jgi:hypothetical protein